jgi:tripartite-type tricarboxylate transporter receptor subunit TctC
MGPIQWIAVASIVASVLTLTSPAFAQSYPTKFVRIVTGNPGSMTDILTRQLAQRLGERWGQPVAVENHGGAGMTVGAGLVARSAPDGYTLLMADRTSIAVAPNLYSKLSYDPVKDFAPISLVAVAPQLLIAHPSVPAENLRAFIDYAKQRPGAVYYASAGPGTAIHITGELLNQTAGIDMVAVQYKGGGAAMVGILSGEVKVGFGLMPVVLPHLRAGKVKAYAITSTTRFAGSPDIPTVAEAGLPEFGSEYYWIGMLAPAGTPAAIVRRVNREIVEILQTAVIQEALLAQGAEPAHGAPEEFAAFIKSEMAKLKKVLVTAGIGAN